MMEELEALRLRLEELAQLREKVARYERVLASAHAVVNGADNDRNDWPRIYQALGPYKHVVSYEEADSLAEELDKHRDTPREYHGYEVHLPRAYDWEITHNGVSVDIAYELWYAHEVALWLLDRKYEQERLWDAAIGGF